MQGIREWVGPLGVPVLELHYSADPDKRAPEWVEQAQVGFPPRQWQREMELDWSIAEGEPVFPEFTEAHVAADTLPVLRSPQYPLWAGWDFGLTPSQVLFQFTPGGGLSLLWVEQAFNQGIRQFAGLVQTQRTRRFGPGLTYQERCDPAGFQRSQVDERTCADELRDQGIVVLPGAQTWEQRRDAVSRWLLARRPDGKPMLQIDPDHCNWLLRGFRGAYCYPKGTASGSEYREGPPKGPFSHSQDALQHALAVAEPPVVAPSWPRRVRSEPPRPANVYARRRR